MSSVTGSRPNLVLIGLRMSGKSTLGRALASERGVMFVDLDDAVLEHMGHATVADAWKAQGEPAFRAAETACLREVLGDASGGVAALGGGTPTAPGASDVIREAQRTGRALVVYLRCTPDELRARFEEYSPGANRPGLTPKGALDEIGDVFDARDPLYRELADHVLENVRSLDEGLALVRPLWREDSG